MSDSTNRAAEQPIGYLEIDGDRATYRRARRATRLTQLVVGAVLGITLWLVARKRAR